MSKSKRAQYNGGIQDRGGSAGAQRPERSGGIASAGSGQSDVHNWVKGVGPATRRAPHELSFHGAAGLFVSAHLSEAQGEIYGALEVFKRPRLYSRHVAYSLARFGRAPRTAAPG